MTLKEFMQEFSIFVSDNYMEMDSQEFERLVSKFNWTQVSVCVSSTTKVIYESNYGELKLQLHLETNTKTVNLGEPCLMSLIILDPNSKHIEIIAV